MKVRQSRGVFIANEAKDEDALKDVFFDGAVIQISHIEYAGEADGERIYEIAFSEVDLSALKLIA